MKAVPPAAHEGGGGLVDGECGLVTAGARELVAQRGVRQRKRRVERDRRLEAADGLGSPTELEQALRAVELRGRDGGREC